MRMRIPPVMMAAIWSQGILAAEGWSRWFAVVQPHIELQTTRY